jgi:hypothetical protein
MYTEKQTYTSLQPHQIPTDTWGINYSQHTKIDEVEDRENDTPVAQVFDFSSYREASDCLPSSMFWLRGRQLLYCIGCGK